LSNLAVIRKQIEDLYPEMTPVFQKVSRFILKEPSKIALYPIRQIAELAGVSTSTVIRFVAMLGYDTYQTFRDALRKDLSSPGVSRYGVDAKQLLRYRAGDVRGELWARTTDTLVQHLVETHNAIPASELQRVANLLHRAGRVGIFGFSGMYAAAFYLRYVLAYVLPDVRLLEDTTSTYLLDLPNFDRNDVVVIVSFEPYAKTAVKVAEFCADNKIPHVAISDTRLSPVSRDAKHALIVPVTGTSFYQTLVPTLTLIEGLISYVVAEIGESAVERVKEAFKKREELGVYWRPNS
jgi:DNA-binding MurR/RpiR family transcriptional regulator